MTAVYCDEIRQVASKIVGNKKHLSEDLMSHVFVYMTTLPAEKIESIQASGAGTPVENIKSYFIRAMYYEFNTPHKQFYQQHRLSLNTPHFPEHLLRPQKNHHAHSGDIRRSFENHDYAKDALIEKTLAALEELPPHEYLTILSAINYKSLHEMQRSTGISRQWIAMTLKNIREKIA